MIYIVHETPIAGKRVINSGIDIFKFLVNLIENLLPNYLILFFVKLVEQNNIG